MTPERIIIEFRATCGEMQIIENGLLIRYTMVLGEDRGTAQIVESKFEEIPGVLSGAGQYKNIGNREETLTLAEIKSDITKSEIFKWFAVGVYGIPIEV